jgi:hypothetical protein
MKWMMNFHESFDQEFESMGRDLQDVLLSHLIPLKLCGPELGRPAVDTLNGSQHGKHEGAAFQTRWRRLARCLLPSIRNATLSCWLPEIKRGADQKKFYKTLIKVADKRYTDHLSTLA